VKIKGDKFRSIDSQFVHYDLPEIKYPFKCEDTSTSKPPKDHQRADILKQWKVSKKNYDQGKTPSLQSTTKCKILD
jgi:hypothetical protein